MNIYTQRVIFWIDQHSYSKNHWKTVAEEYLTQENGNINSASHRLAEALQGFHHQFQDTVIKPQNVLHDFISMAFDQVDWLHVAKTRFH